MGRFQSSGPMRELEKQLKALGNLKKTKKQLKTGGSFRVTYAVKSLHAVVMETHPSIFNSTKDHETHSSFVRGAFALLAFGRGAFSAFS